MMFHENLLLADDSHEISYLIFFSKIEKMSIKFVVCCSRDWPFKGPIAPHKAAYCVFTQFCERENAIKFISVRTKTQ